MPVDDVVDAPVTLAGLFAGGSDDGSGEEEGEAPYAPVYEVQTVKLGGLALRVRQFDHHSHNANRVWPGTFNLCAFLLRPDGPPLGHVLELGTATGLLAIRLCRGRVGAGTTGGNDEDNDDGTAAEAPLCHSITTSDVVDEHDEIAENLRHNYELNGIHDPPAHVPHTWGTGWAASVARRRAEPPAPAKGGALPAAAPSVPDAFDTVVASDILLYISAYPALVQTLEELVGPQTRFVMSWNRRMKESQDFFQQMEEAGFTCQHHGKCVYEFRRMTSANEHSESN